VLEEKNDNDKTFDADKAMEGLEERLATKMGESMEKMEDRIVDRVKPVQKEEDLGIDWGEDEDDDKEEKEPKYVSKKDLKGIAEAIKKDVTRESESRSEAKTRKQQKDMQAVNEFPEMHPQSPYYNKRFHDEIQKELSNIIRDEGRESATDLRYAAATVASRGVREGWYNPKERVVRETNRSNAREDNFDVTPRSEGARDSSGSLRVAEKMGLGSERAKQLLDIRDKYKK